MQLFSLSLSFLPSFLPYLPSILLFFLSPSCMCEASSSHFLGTFFVHKIHSMGIQRRALGTHMDRQRGELCFSDGLCHRIEPSVRKRPYTNWDQVGHGQREACQSAELFMMVGKPRAWEPAGPWRCGQYNQPRNKLGVDCSCSRLQGTHVWFRRLFLTGGK